MKKIALVLIIAGTLVLLVPTLQHIYSSNAQNKLISEWENVVISESHNYLGYDVESDDFFVVSQNYRALNDTFTNLSIENEQEIVEPNEEVEVEVEQVESSQKPQSIETQPIGLISIPKIDLTMPILEGATERNLKNAAAHITGTSSFGEVGNTAIAGHRGYRFGALFNRLDEIMQGDIIEIHSINQVYMYEVYKVSVVEPTDLSVLKRNNTDRVLTLITCDPIPAATHRLIVHAVLK